MLWLKTVGGILLSLVGLVWLGQGLSIIPGSFMTGQLQWALFGAILLAVAVWLLWSSVSALRQRG
jgi:hypothetical protein